MSDIDFYRDITFASDNPATTDEFPTRAHQRVAKTLVAIIRGGDGGRAIGLEGTWGSGKSTVIDFALAEFNAANAKSDTRYSVFVFDAWAHQGDPIRRVFLEELIASLSAAGAVDKRKWNDELEKLQSKKKKTTETRAEKLSAVARATLLALPLYPAAYGLVAAAVSDNTKGSLAGLPVWLLALLGVGIIVAPYIAAVATWIAWRNRPEMSGKSVIWAFNKQTDHVTTEQFIREDEATSIEFNAHFDALVEDARLRNYRLIIVLDNLDRLANDQIRDLWATMRNFFAATPGSERKKILKNVWLVVPIDRQHIEAVFADKEADGGEKHTTRGFIEKTFEIVLRVSPPLLSNWRSFLERTLKDCFGDKISQVESYRIFRLFEVFQTIRPTVITPRAIKAYANKIVAQAKLSGNIIPLEYQALFVLYRDDIANDIRRLQDSTLLEPPMASSMNDTVWAKYLAAAHFNARPEDALEILLSPEIERALLEKSADRLDELKNTGGFDSVLHNVIASKTTAWAAENPSNFFEIAATLEKVAPKDAAVSNSIWNDLARGVASIKKPLVPSTLCAVGIRALLMHDSGKAAVRNGIRSALIIPRGEMPEGSQAAGVSWFDLVDAYASSLVDRLAEGEYEVSTSGIAIHGDVNYLIGVAEGIAGSKYLDITDFTFSHAPDAVANAIVSLVHSTELSEILGRIVASFLKAPQTVDWNIVVDAAAGRLQSNNPALSANSGWMLLTTLRSIAAVDKKALTVLQQISSDGSLHGLLEIGRREGNSKLIALTIYEAILRRGANLVGPPEHAQYGQLGSTNEFLNQLQTTPADNIELVNEIADFALQRGVFAQILKLALPPEKDRELYRAIFRRMIESPIDKRNILSEVLTNFDRIDEIVGKELRARLLEALDKFSITAELSDEKWRNITTSFVVASKEARTKHYHEVVRSVAVGLGNLSANDWEKVLDAESNELALAFELIELNELRSLDTAFFDALKSHAEKLIDGVSTPNKFAKQWQELPKVLPYSQRVPFYKFVRDLLTNKAPKAEIIVRAFDAYGEKLGEDANLRERDDDVIRNIIDPLMADGSDASLTILERNSYAFGDIVRRAKKENQEFVAHRFNSVFLGADNDLKSRLEAIAKALGIKIEASEELDETKSEVKS